MCGDGIDNVFYEVHNFKPLKAHSVIIHWTKGVIEGDHISKDNAIKYFIYLFPIRVTIKVKVTGLTVGSHLLSITKRQLYCYICMYNSKIILYFIMHISVSIKKLVFYESQLTT